MKQIIYVHQMKVVGTDYLSISLETTAVFVDYKIKSCIISSLSEQLL